jgi:hypothetical protein
MSNSIPNISSTMNATSMEQMKKQMQAMIEGAAAGAANEIGKLVSRACKVTKTDIKQSSGVVPECNDNYLQATILAAAFRALRDEFATAYMRVEAAQVDKALCSERLTTGAVRSDTEKASLERSLQYYDTLDQRLEEAESALTSTVAAYQQICERQWADDKARQQGLPEEEVKLTSMPQLRWIKNDDRQQDPKNCELNDDITSAQRQATRFLEWNWNR